MNYLILQGCKTKAPSLVIIISVCGYASTAHNRTLSTSASSPPLHPTRTHTHARTFPHPSFLISLSSSNSVTPSSAQWARGAISANPPSCLSLFLSLSSDTVHRALIKERSGASIRPSTQPTEPQRLVWKHLAPALIRTLLLPLNQVKNKTNKQNENKDKCLCGN